MTHGGTSGKRHCFAALNKCHMAGGTQGTHPGSGVFLSCSLISCRPCAQPEISIFPKGLSIVLYLILQALSILPSTYEKGFSSK